VADTDPDEAVEFDAQDLLRQIHAAGEDGRRMAELRPSREAIKKNLETYRDLFSACLELRSLENVPVDIALGENDYRKSLWYPAAGSVAEADYMWAEGLSAAWSENPIRSNFDLIRRLISAALDHTAGLATLMGTNLARAPLAAARAAMEAVATAAFMMDPNQDPMERLRRGLNIRLLELDEKRRAAEGQLKQEAHDEIQSIVDAAPSADMEVNWRPKRLPYIPNASNTTDSAAWMIGDLLAHQDIGASFYRSTSGAIHSRDDVTSLLMWDWNGYPDARSRDRDVTFGTIGAVLTLIALVPRVATYTGWDLDVIVPAGDTLLTGWALASGQYDELLEKTVSEARRSG
jgi:hypothetical protein